MRKEGISEEHAEKERDKNPILPIFPGTEELIEK
jgi:hypothetical protein